MIDENDPLHEDTYFYNKQLRNYIIQAMAVFAEFKVMIGASETRPARTINIPIHYGAKDRVVAAIKADNTPNKPIRVPCMSMYLPSLNLAPELRKGNGNSRRNTYLPSGGIFPDDIRVVHQMMPVPYKANLELTIFVSSTDQHFQLLEQIASIFNPSVQLQSSDDLFDWTKITTLELTGINFEQAYPSGADRRIITSTLTFDMPVYIGIPADIRDKFIKSIMIRIGQMSAGHSGVVNVSTPEEDLIFELDDQDIPVTTLIDVDEVDLNG